VASFVIVHGAFGGGWEWTPVARRLRAQGHEAWTPTLTGLGERAHLATPDTDLRTHVDDVLALLRMEGLRDVVLCGASYGGMVVTQVVDEASELLSCVVYVDALVPRDGESAADLLPSGFREEVRRRAARPDDFLVPVPEAVVPPREGLAAAAWHHYASRLVPQPAATFLGPVRLQGRGASVPTAFVRCTGGHLEVDPIRPMAARAQEAGWMYRELRLPHDPHLFDASAVATSLESIAAAICRPTGSGVPSRT
jgi:pimeloyl-ACP methyl ester carboxylesterase